MGCNTGIRRLGIGGSSFQACNRCWYFFVWFAGGFLRHFLDVACSLFCCLSFQLVHLVCPILFCFRFGMLFLIYICCHLMVVVVGCKTC